MSNWNSIQELVGTDSCVCAGFGRVQCMAALSQKLLNIPIGLFSISAVCCLTPDIKFSSSFLKGERSHSSFPVEKKSASKLAILIVKNSFSCYKTKPLYLLQKECHENVPKVEYTCTRIVLLHFTIGLYNTEITLV